MAGKSILDTLFDLRRVAFAHGLVNLHVIF